jgi:hypothetical protein
VLNFRGVKNVVIPGADFTYVPVAGLIEPLDNTQLRRFGVHRFDWLPATTTYSYAGTTNSGATITVTRSSSCRARVLTNEQSSTAITTFVPTTPAEFVINVWSNGDP